MPSQRYERIAEHDDDDASPMSSQSPYPIPNSPPPSFHSRASSPNGGASRRLLSDDPLAEDKDTTLADTFGSPSDDEGSDDEDGDGMDDRQRLMRGQPDQQSNDEATNGPPTRMGIERRVTQFPVFPQATGTTRGRIFGGGQNDGVFANLSAKPTRGEELEEKPPTYEQAAADATPPYWETTILGAPGSFGDEVFVEGLAVGSVFSFVWNAMISMSFMLVGFLLTYLLHTTHAAKNGSRAGLGITLVQYGFSMKGASNLAPSDSNNDFGSGIPDDPNAHDFDPSQVAPSSGGPVTTPASSGISSSDWLAYGLMIVGWFILIKSISDFVRARRHEQLVLQSPDRGLGVAVVAEDERPETSV